MISLRTYQRVTHPRLFCEVQFRSSSSATRTNHVRIVEVGPRDGLQNIKQTVPTTTKIELIQKLSDTGLKDIEATSFVSPKWVPQLADSAEVMGEVLKLQQQQGDHLNFPVLAPNLKGLQRASASDAKEIVVFASVTEAFSKANQNCTVAEALDQAEAVTKEARKLGIRVRGYVMSMLGKSFRKLLSLTPRCYQ